MTYKHQQKISLQVPHSGKKKWPKRSPAFFGFTPAPVFAKRQAASSVPFHFGPKAAKLRLQMQISFEKH